MMRFAAAMCVILCASVLSAPTAAAAGLPQRCGQATLTTSNPSTGITSAPTPHGDGKYTPVLMVHGWNGDPGMWWAPIDHSTLTGHKVSNARSLAGNVQRLAGAAVYTLDYHDVAERWFTQPGAGGQLFLDAARCLMEDNAFVGHKMIVVAHSMGGLITRWAVNSDERLRTGTSLVLTLGTPYEGSWLATVGLVLMDAARVASALDPRLVRLRTALHLLILGCRAHDNVPGCAELNRFMRQIETVRAFAFGSSEMATLTPWPNDISVKTVAGRVVLENAAAELFLDTPVPGDLDLGDGVVGVDSATDGRKLAVAECRYTASKWRAGVDGLLASVGLKADVDTRTYDPLVVALFSSAYSTCGHVGESRLIQLTNQVLGEVADQLAREEPDPRVVRFDGIGASWLGLTAEQLRTRGYSNHGNLYEGMNASCVGYVKDGQPLSFSVESATGRVIAIRNGTGDRKLRTQVGGVRAGSTLAQLRAAFGGYAIEEHFDQDFGQGGNGVIVTGPAGAIGFSLSDAPKSDYQSGRATITLIHGVGLPGHAPSLREDGC